MSLTIHSPLLKLQYFPFTSTHSFFHTHVLQPFLTHSFFPKPFLESLTKNNTNKKCQNPFASPPAHWWYLSPFYLLSVKLSETCLFPLLPFPFPDFTPTYIPQTLPEIKTHFCFTFSNLFVIKDINDHNCPQNLILPQLPRISPPVA